MPKCSKERSKKDQRKNEKAVVDALWVSVVTKASKEDLTKYIETSQICMKKVLLNVIRKQVSECEKSESNKIRSVRVLYEGGLMTKKKYTALCVIVPSRGVLAAQAWTEHYACSLTWWPCFVQLKINIQVHTISWCQK